MADNNPKEKEEEASIYKLDTVPPPAGDDDAYHAPTKVGPRSMGELEALILKADEEGRRSVEALQQAPESARPFSRKPPAEPSGPPRSSAAPTSNQPAEQVPILPPPDELAGSPDIPRLYEDGEDRDESNAATLLHPLAKEVRDDGARADAEEILGPSLSPPEAPPDGDAHAPIVSPFHVVARPSLAARARAVLVVLCMALFAWGLLTYLLR